MKILICASARAEIVIKCIREFSVQGEVIVIAPSPVYDGLPEFDNADRVRVIKFNGSSFNNISNDGMDSLSNISFDKAIIVSGGLGFIGFNNVIETIA